MKKIFIVTLVLGFVLDLLDYGKVSKILYEMEDLLKKSHPRLISLANFDLAPEGRKSSKGNHTIKR